MKSSTKITVANFLLLLTASAQAFKLRVMETKMAPDSDMDGGLFGGEFRMTICKRSSCCGTGVLNTEDDNWEAGERNFFVGPQLGKCENFLLDSAPEANVTLTVQHKGFDAGKIQHVVLRGPLRLQKEVKCDVNEELDNSEEKTFPCQYIAPPDQGSQKPCMGKHQYCDLNFKEFMFAGAHNSGTGMSDFSYIINCIYKNHDLDMEGLLDFGVRFIDLDITNRAPQGLQTIHGGKFFGTIRDVFTATTKWLDENPSEVAIIHFGTLEDERQTFEALKEEIAFWFTGSQRLSHVDVNKMYQEVGAWPTLGEAVSTNQRLFLFVRLKEEHSAVAPSSVDSFYTKVEKIDDEDFDKPKPDLGRGKTSIVSTYGPGYAGKNCQKVVDRTEDRCSRLQGDFLKLAAYGKTKWFSIHCLETMARECNSRLREIMDECEKSGKIINFVTTDFPNYPGKAGKTVVEYVEEENLKKVAVRG